MIHRCMDCIKGVTRETSTKPPCKKEYKCGTTCPVCFKLCLSFINIIKICTNHGTNVPNTWLIANKLGQLTCINGRRFQSCNSNNSQFSLFTGSTSYGCIIKPEEYDCMIHRLVWTASRE